MRPPASTVGLDRPPTCRAVTEILLADIETPLSAYWKLAHDEDHSFLLESVTGGEQLARYSMIGVRPSAVLRGKNGQASLIKPDGSTEAREINDPLEWLRDVLPRVDGEESVGQPRFCGGAVGTLGYDYVRTIERLPDANPDPLQIDDAALMVCRSVVVFDHAKNVVRLTALAENTEESLAEANAEIARLKERLQKPLPLLPTGSFPTHPVHQETTKDQFCRTVDKVKQYIVEGDCMQVVPSIRLSTQVDAHPVTVYRALRSLNPSPFMFLVRFPDHDVVGASPELLVGLQDDHATVRPIAGTRPRHDDPAEDAALAAELLADEKERAEHLMLVDLGRNDLGRVSATGTVTVTDMMQIERYSHVMHIVSHVRGKLADGLDGIDLVRAAFPAGTLSGAPKIRAMEIIDEVESTRRGLYGGAVGYFSANGDVDLAIAIRTILLKDGKAYVQAGAGIVYDSIPENEHQECLNKAGAALRALEIAQAGL